jgi:hypothetical protein
MQPSHERKEPRLFWFNVNWPLSVKDKLVRPRSTDGVLYASQPAYSKLNVIEPETKYVALQGPGLLWVAAGLVE